MDVKIENCPYLVACSAYVDRKTEQDAFKSGFDDIIESPLNQENL
jgi:CheY-like chemotaxis protein